jgi:hypothetical protein
MLPVPGDNHMKNMLFHEKEKIVVQEESYTVDLKKMLFIYPHHLTALTAAASTRGGMTVRRGDGIILTCNIHTNIADKIANLSKRDMFEVCYYKMLLQNMLSLILLNLLNHPLRIMDLPCF